MSSVALAQPCTYRDLVAMPDDGLRHELLDGEHVVSPSPGTSHQLILWNLTRELGAYLAANDGGTALTGPYDIKLSVFTMLVPDLVFFTAERFALVVNEKHATAAPDLVVEILSPGTRRRDKGRKRAIYEREGVREYWIVDPAAAEITTLTRQDGEDGFAVVATLAQTRGDVVASPLFPGLAIPLARIFG
jgi:Uma2 family endonuclease